jgi:hypothetical protein
MLACKAEALQYCVHDSFLCITLQKYLVMGKLIPSVYCSSSSDNYFVVEFCSSNFTYTLNKLYIN